MTDPTQAEVPADMKACVSCGGKGGLRYSRDGEAEWVACKNCGNEGPIRMTAQEAVDAWNATPSTPVQGAGEADHTPPRRDTVHLPADLIARIQWMLDDPLLAKALLAEHIALMVAGSSTPPAPASVADEAREEAARRCLVDHGISPWPAAVEAMLTYADLAFAARPAGEGERLREALEKIERKYREWDRDGSFASAELADCSRIARAALATEGTRS